MEHERQTLHTKEREHTKINVTDETPIHYWASLLGCTKVDLVHAMSVMGNSYEMIDLYLTLNRQKIKRGGYT